jgi:hypothetical protein
MCIRDSDHVEQVAYRGLALRGGHAHAHEGLAGSPR